ncbi:MAG: dethiobiotin synthase [Methylococcales bacterium]|nr:dethiobiotin synthase [Methylococcales bacterium]MCK5926047.1 dethiobiotin synthase [Methylococcales bacterium]
MKQGFFITGTDTGVGKTAATVALMTYFKRQEQTVVGMKPIASGCENIDGVLKNEDALLLQQHASMPLSYQKINSYSFLEPVSPHLAVDKEVIRLDKIIQDADFLSTQADILLVEGVGGWLVPLNNQGDTVETLATVLDLPVILVVGIRLGCINHAHLSYRAIQASGVNCAGWLAMCLEPEMLKIRENIATIKKTIDSPLLGVLPYSKVLDFELLANNIFFD